MLGQLIWETLAALPDHNHCITSVVIMTHSMAADSCQSMGLCGS